MDLGQSARRAWSTLTRFGRAPAAPAGDGPDIAPANVDPPPARTAARRPWPLYAALALILIVPSYYLVGAWTTYRINDDLRYAAPQAPAQASQTVANIAGLITREVDETAWSPNTPPFAPAALLRFGGNMPNFQAGLARALSMVVVELEGRVGRLRGTGAADEDLGEAREGLSRRPETWILNPLPTSSADGEYRRARDALLRYNGRLQRGDAVFDERADNLLGVLDRIALDIGAASDETERQIIVGRRVFIDRRADKIFYFNKGKAYAYYIVALGLRRDFAEVITERRVARIYDAMVEDLARAAGLQPMVVQNASPEALMMPNHLAVQGFYLLRARAKLREITDILAK